MLSEINEQVIHNTCRRPLCELSGFQLTTVVQQLAGFARWALIPEALSRFAESNPSFLPSRTTVAEPAVKMLPQDRGACWVVFATNDPDRVPLLRRAFVLPLVWSDREKTHSPQLPQGLAAMADRVLRTLAEEGHVPVDGPQWTLQFAPGSGLRRCDLSNLLLEYESGWVSLAAGLMLAIEGGVPDRTVWASAVWHEGGGLHGVAAETLSEKLNLAAEFGAREFFVSESTARTIRDQGREWPFQIRALPEGVAAPRQALLDYFNSLDVPPRETDPFERRKQYFLRSRETSHALAYYDRCLLRTVSENVHRKIVIRFPNWSATHFVTIVSGRPQLVRVGVEAISPQQCLLLYTPEENHIQQELPKVSRMLQDRGVNVTPFEFSNTADMHSSFEQAITAFARGVAPERLVFDLTPGSKLMTLTLAAVAPVGSYLYCLWHRTEKENRTNLPIPGEEIPILWQKRGPFNGLIAGETPHDSLG